ncbi:MAG: hypothetical protein WC289_05810, partial [Patescibacteria group bacterium]
MRSSRSTVVSYMLVVAICVMSVGFVFQNVSAAVPPTLAGASLIRPTTTVVGTVPFEADLGNASPGENAVVAFTVYRLVGGIPEAGRYCFLSPSPTRESGTTHWIIGNVDTRRVTGNCSSSLVGWGTVYAPEDGTYRFGIWIDGAEYITNDSVTIQNGIESVPVNDPQTNQNGNTNVSQNSNQGSNQNTNTNANSNTNTGTPPTNTQNQNTNQQVNTNSGNTNVPPSNSNTNTTNAPSSNQNSGNGNVHVPASNQPGDPQADEVDISFTRPLAGANVQGDVVVGARVSGITADQIGSVVFSVYHRATWYTIGKGQEGSQGEWSLTWTTNNMSDGTVYGVMRVYLESGLIY